MDEGLVVRFWLAGLLNERASRLVDGRAIRVVYRGRHSRGAGPDFRGAILDVDGSIVRGDVELHVRSRDWLVHGHARDARYDQVVLHVVWHYQAVPVMTRAGSALAVLALEPLFGTTDALLEALIA